MPKFIHINEVIKLPMLGDQDYLFRSKGRLLSWSKFVYQDMDLSVMKVAVREEFQINKRTNSIQLPKNTLQLSSVNIRHNGVYWPVYRNEKISDDIVEIGASKDCACEHKCGYKLCNTIKGYEAVTSTKSDFLPDGTPISFTCIDRKVTDKGFLLEVTQKPLRVYVSGVWTDTVLDTEEKFLCSVEVDDNGCVCDTEENINAVCGTCVSKSGGNIPVGGTAELPPCEGDDTWIYWCNSKLDWFSTQCGGGCFGKKEFNNIYNISELGDRLIFPANFGFDKVMIRYYVDVKLQDMQIPFIAVDTFVTGLLWFDHKYSTDMNKQKLAELFGSRYAKMKFGLLRELNKYRIAELGQIFSPQTYIPSYADKRDYFYYY